MTGFVAAYREVVDHPLFAGNSERLGAWMWLVMKAAWKPTPFDVAGKVVTIERGQVCVSRAQLAKAWGMSPSGVERFLTRLKTEQMIEQETGQGRSIITICNYSKYQDISDEAGQPTGQATGQRSDSDRTAKEQGNKGTRDIKPKGSISQGASAPKSKKQKSPLCSLPDDWLPMPFGLGTKSRGIVDGWPPGRLEFQADRFRANHKSKGSQFSDWQAAWSTWVLNTVEFGKSRNGKGFSHNGDGAEQPHGLAEAIVARRARRGGEQQGFL